MRVLEDGRLKWFGYLERMEESGWSSKSRTCRVSHSLHRGRPKKTWYEVIRKDLKERKIRKNIAKDRNAWKSFI